MKRRKAVPKPAPARTLAGLIARTWSKAEHEVVRLNAWANQLEGLWWNATPEVRERLVERDIASRPLPELVLMDTERLAIAAFLRRLAANPAALEALTGAPKRGRPRGDTKDYRVALDYLATRERLGKSEAAQTEVGKAWGLSRASVMRAYRQGTLKNLRRPGRTYRGDPVSGELARIESDNPNLTRAELLVAVSAKLRKNKSK